MRPALILVALAALVGALLFARGCERSGAREPANEPSISVPAATGDAPSTTTPREVPVVSTDRTALLPAAEPTPPDPEVSTSPPAPLDPGGLRVRVVDAAGKPIGGVLVTLRWHVGGGQGAFAAQATTRTPDGLARLDLAELEKLRKNPQMAVLGMTFAVEAKVASATPVRQALPGWPSGDDEVELALPPVGSVRVRVLSREGAPIAGEATVGWWWVPSDVAAADPDCAYDRVPEHLGETRAGSTVIEGVGLGLTLQFVASAPGFGQTSVRGVTGPRVAGESTDVELRLGAPLATIVLHVLDVAGNPLAATTLRGELWIDAETIPHPNAGPVRPDWLVLASDATGLVSFTLSSGSRAVAPHLYVVRRSPDRDAAQDEHWSVGSVRLPQVLAEGERVDLGEVRLAPVPVLAEGRVVDAAGNPVTRASVMLQERFGPAPDHRWFNVHDGRTTVEADGHFRVRGPRLPRALAIRVDASGFVSRVLEDVEVGARDLALVLEREAPAESKGSVRLRVELEPEISPMALLIKVGRKRGGSRSPDWWPGQVIEVKGLVPGTYDVWIETREGDMELARVTGVEVKDGAPTEDARLSPFDVRGLAQAVQLEVVRPDGTPWRRQSLFIDALEPRADFRMRTDDEGKVSLVLPRRITSLDLALEDKAATRVAWSAGQAAIRVVLAGG